MTFECDIVGSDATYSGYLKVSQPRLVLFEAMVIAEHHFWVFNAINDAKVLLP